MWTSQFRDHIDYWHGLTVDPTESDNVTHVELAPLVFRGFKKPLIAIGAHLETGQVPAHELARERLTILGTLGISLLLRNEGVDELTSREGSGMVFDLVERGRPRIHSSPPAEESALPTEGQWYRTKGLYVHQLPLDPSSPGREVDQSFITTMPYASAIPNR